MVDTYGRPYGHYVDVLNKGGRAPRFRRVMARLQKGWKYSTSFFDNGHGDRLTDAIDIGDVEWLKKSGAKYWIPHQRRWSRNWSFAKPMLTLSHLRRNKRSSVRGAKR